MRLPLRFTVTLALLCAPLPALAEPPWPMWFIVVALAFSLSVQLAIGAAVGIITASRGVGHWRAAAYTCGAIFLVIFVIASLQSEGHEQVPASVAALIAVVTVGGPIVVGVLLGHAWLKRSQKLSEAEFKPLGPRRVRYEAAAAISVLMMVIAIDGWRATHAYNPAASTCEQIPVKDWRIEAGSGEDAVLVVKVRPTVTTAARIGSASFRARGGGTIASGEQYRPDKLVELAAGQEATLTLPYRWQRRDAISSARFSICPGQVPALHSSCASWGYGDWTQSDGKRFCTFPFEPLPKL